MLTTERQQFSAVRGKQITAPVTASWTRRYCFRRCTSLLSSLLEMALYSHAESLSGCEAQIKSTP